ELLVIRSGRRTGLVRGGVPVARGVGRERLVDEDDLAVAHAELELRVGEDESLPQRVLVRRAVELEGDALELLREIAPHRSGKLGARDVLVVPRELLRRGGEDRFGEPLRLDEADRELLARDGAESFVFVPSRPADVAA